MICVGENEPKSALVVFFCDSQGLLVQRAEGGNKKENKELNFNGAEEQLTNLPSASEY